MHGEDISFAYGFWSLVVVNVVLFVFFVLSFLTPVKKREWRSMGVTIPRAHSCLLPLVKEGRK